MRLCSTWDPRSGSPVLCVVDAGGGLLPVGTGGRRYTDVAALVAATDEDADLETLTRAAGVAGPPLAAWDDVVAAELSRDRPHLLPPVRPVEVWAAGVTYQRSRDARMQESADADVYERVYRSERPELFLKATAARVVGPGARIGLRGDSAWQVPEPELVLVIGRGGRVLGYTLGNDVSSRDIEGENPLYVPQAKIFAGSCSLGPVVVTAGELDFADGFAISLVVRRTGFTVFSGDTNTARLHVTPETLVRYLAAENWLPPVTALLTGTGIVPPDDVSLQPGDEVEIHCPAIGTLRNVCSRAGEMDAPAGWWSHGP